MNVITLKIFLNAFRCEEEDRVTAYVLVASRMSKIYDFCGHELPPQLMSAKNLLTLDYVIRNGVPAVNRVSPNQYVKTSAPTMLNELGFVLEYRFIKDYGEQSEEAIINSNLSMFK